MGRQRSVELHFIPESQGIFARFPWPGGRAGGGGGRGKNFGTAVFQPLKLKPFKSTSGHLAEQVVFVAVPRDALTRLVLLAVRYDLVKL